MRRRVSSRPALAAFLAVVALVAAGSAAARTHAQLPQERGLLERIQRPDLALAYHPAEKTFGGRNAGSAPWRKGAVTRTFPFGRRAAVKPYAAKGFAGSRGFASGNFASRDRTAAGANAPVAAGADRAFATRDVDVREARDARKALSVRAARVPNFTPVGKRQDALDEQQRTRPLTIDEVRELLNKSR